jgi:hypothetical protein
VVRVAVMGAMVVREGAGEGAAGSPGVGVVGVVGGGVVAPWVVSGAAASGLGAGGGALGPMMRGQIMNTAMESTKAISSLFRSLIDAKPRWVCALWGARGRHRAVGRGGVGKRRGCALTGPGHGRQDGGDDSAVSGDRPDTSL